MMAGRGTAIAGRAEHSGPADRSDVQASMSFLAFATPVTASGA